MISNLSSKESGCGCGSSGISAAPCSCGGAGCGSCVAQGIVRPRFFAGQLLTEDDLQLLTDYVGHKNRLHNRHLFGAGVVCGLEVTCDPCGDGRVIVHPGYAIDCCGNDLTLSCTQVVDVNGLVRKLGKDCTDPCPPEPKKLKGEKQIDDEGTKQKDTEEEKPNFHYCLYIRYCEQPSDPVTPYSTGEECVQLGCEPTRIREGVSFELRCGGRHSARNPLIERLCQSLGDLDKLPRVFEAFNQLQDHGKVLAAAKVRIIRSGVIVRPKPIGVPIEEESPPTQVSPATAKALVAARAPFKTVRDWLIERLSKSAYLTDCTTKRRVYELIMPRGDDPTIIEVNAAADSTKDLIILFIDYFRESLCRGLNPACVTCEDSAVLLACLDLEECEVTRICNMERNFVLSPAAVRYWLPPLQLMGNVLERLCCVPWLDLPRKDQSRDPDLGELVKEEIARIVRDSVCGISEPRLQSMLDLLEQSFRRDSNEKQVVTSTPSLWEDFAPSKAESAKEEAATELAAKEAAAKEAAAKAAAEKKARASASKRPVSKPRVQKKSGLKNKPEAEPAVPEVTPPAETPKGDNT